MLYQTAEWQKDNCYADMLIFKVCVFGNISREKLSTFFQYLFSVLCEQKKIETNGQLQKGPSLGFQPQICQYCAFLGVNALLPREHESNGWIPCLQWNIFINVSAMKLMHSPRGTFSQAATILSRINACQTTLLVKRFFPGDHYSDIRSITKNFGL